MADAYEPEDLLGLALHESGHAVAAVALGFDLRSIELKGEESSTFLETVFGCCGETESTASEVTPADGDADRRKRSAIVAMAGREGKKLQYPDADAEWYHLDLDDRVRALALLGSQRSRRQIEEAPEDSADEALLAGVVADAKALLTRHRQSVETLARALADKGCPSFLTAAEALAIMGPPFGGTPSGPTRG